MATFYTVIGAALILLECVLCKEVVSTTGRVDNALRETETSINKRGIPFKRLPAWSVFYGKRSSEVEQTSKRGSPPDDVAPSGNYLNEESGNDKSDGRKYDDNYRAELQSLLSSFDHAGSFNANGASSDVIGAVKDAGTKTVEAWMSADDTLSGDLLDDIDNTDNNDDENIPDIDINDVIADDDGYPLEDGDSPETVMSFKDGDADKRSGWSAVYGKRMPGWFATYGKRLTEMNPLYRRGAPAWSVTYGKRVPGWNVGYGKRAPSWQATHGKRAPAWQVTYGKRAPAWQATYGKRAPAWQVTYGKRAPAWQVTYGKRAPAWQTTYGERTPSAFSINNLAKSLRENNKRAPAWQATYGKRAHWGVTYGKRTPAWSVTYGKRLPAWSVTYGKREADSDDMNGSLDEVMYDKNVDDDGLADIKHSFNSKHFQAGQVSRTL